MMRIRVAGGRLNRLLDLPYPPRGFKAPSQVWFGCIYRARNAAVVETLIRSGIERGWRIHLWALDSIDPRLMQYTAGVGGGGKFELLQRMLDEHPPTPSAWVVLSDDDYAFRRGTLMDLIALAQQAYLDIAQPAHRRFVHASHHITLVRPRVVARRTHFVEIGPVVVMSPRGQSEALPFPEARMGWGLEFLWSRASLDDRVRLGIIDAVTIDHLAPVGEGYDQEAARLELEVFRREAGIRAYGDVQVNLGWWRRLSRGRNAMSGPDPEA